MLLFNGKKFKNEREKHGYTYGQFAEKLRAFYPKASKTIIRNWERGSPPGATYLIAISKILNQDPEYFMKEVKEMPKAMKKAKEERSKKKKGP